MAPVWTSVFLAASALATVFAGEGTVVITGCKDDTTTTVVEGRYLYLDCYDLTNADGVFHWTLTTENGTQIPLGTCHAVNNCTSSVTNIYISRWSSARSDLGISSIPKNMTGDIACTVRTKNGVGTDTCRVNVVRILNFPAVIDALDGHTYYGFLEYISPTGRISTTLTLTTESGKVIALGNCTTVQHQCTSKSGIFRVYSSSNYFEISSQTAAERGFAGRISVSVLYGRETETADILLNVYSSPKVSNCTIDVHQHNWTAVLSCDILKTFSSAGIYRFQVLEFSPNSSFIQLNDYSNLRRAKSSCELKRHEERSFLPDMHSYNETTNNKTYYGGRLKYSWRLSTFNKDYKFASVLVCTSSSVYGCTFPQPLFIPLPKVDSSMDDQDCDCEEPVGWVIGPGAV